MAEQTIATGLDTWIESAAASKGHPDAKYPKLKTGAERTLLSMPLSGLSGAVIVSAILSVPVRGSWAAQTVTVQALDGSWKVDRVNWNNQPGVLGSTATEATGALSDGNRVEVDVTALVQAIADGQANYGWRVTTNAASSQAVYGFDSGAESWTLTIETSDVPSAPTHVTPTGVVSLNKWVVSVDDIDDIASIHVQIDAAMDTVSPDFDSGVVSTTVPRLDLATTAYAGLADGATTYQRARVKPTGGEWSEWSDWFEVTRHVKPTITLSSPSGAAFWSSTPDITASLSPAGTSATTWRVLLADPLDATKVRWDSGVLTGASIDEAVPLRYEGNVVMPTDGDYRLIVRAWDRTDRVASYGDPTYVETALTVTLDVDGALNPVDTIGAVPVGENSPGILVSWTRASDPDEFHVFRNGHLIEVVNVDDARVAPGEWEWIDRTAPPNTDSEYVVRCVTLLIGQLKQSDDSAPAASDHPVTGVWILSDLVPDGVTADHGDVLLYGDDVDNIEQTEKRISFELPYRSDPVDIVTSIDGFVGSYAGEIDNRGEQDVDDARQILEALRRSPKTEVRLVWGTANIPVRLRGLSVATHPQMTTRMRQHRVKFGFAQSGEFEGL